MRRVFLLLLGIALLFPFNLFAAPGVSLFISPASISFSGGNPDCMPLIPSRKELNISLRVWGNDEGSWELTLLSQGDLQGGGAVIPISHITFLPSLSPPFIQGSLSRHAPQVIGRGRGDIDVNFDLRLFLKNSWDYAAGNYSQRITFTLSAP